jgi:ribosomal protein L37E
MSKKLDAMLSEVEGLLSAAAAVSAKKKPQHAIEKDAKGKWRIRSMKDGKLWPQTYDSKAMANKGLAAYHLRKKGVPPKKTKASAECPECGSEAHIDMSGKSCPSCGWSDDAELHRRIQDGDEEGAADMLDEAMSASVDNMDMIRQLRDEAAAHGDMAQVELCDLALEGDEDAIAECMMAIESAKAMASAKASTVKADVAYSPKNKMYLRKLQRLVDRGYLLPEEVGGAIFEALHMAKVSNRMAGAIASKVQEALMSAEPDVVDVSARARRK